MTCVLVFIFKGVFPLLPSGRVGLLAPSVSRPRGFAVLHLVYGSLAAEED